MLTFWDSSPKSQINLVHVLFQLKVTLDISLCSDNWFASRQYLTLTQLKFFLHFTLIELSGRSTLDMTEIISFQLELSERGSFVKEWKFWNEIPLKNSFEVKLPILYFTKISSASSSVKLIYNSMNFGYNWFLWKNISTCWKFKNCELILKKVIAIVWKH